MIGMAVEIAIASNAMMVTRETRQMVTRRCAGDMGPGARRLVFWGAIASVTVTRLVGRRRGPGVGVGAAPGSASPGPWAGGDPAGQLIAPGRRAWQAPGALDPPRGPGLLPRADVAKERDVTVQPPLHADGEAPPRHPGPPAGGPGPL